MAKRWKVGSILAFCFLTITLPFLLSGCGLIDYLIGDLPGDIPYDQIELPNGDLIQYDIFDTICDESMVSWKSERGLIAYLENNKWHFPSASNPGGEAEEWLNPEVVNVGFEDKEDWDFSDVFLYLDKETTSTHAHINIKLFNAEADCLNPTSITFQPYEYTLEYKVTRDWSQESEEYIQSDYPLTVQLFPNNGFSGHSIDIFVNQITSPFKLYQAEVVKIIDGDTIVLDKEIPVGAPKPKRIRYTGIDTPELENGAEEDECFAADAKERNRTLVQNKTVWIELDKRKVGGEGRVLGYVHTSPDVSLDSMVTYKLLNEGYAKIFKVDENWKYVEEFREAQIKAVRNRRGTWANDGCGDYAGADIVIAAIQYWSKDEFAVILNRGSKPVNLNGWVLKNQTGDSYRFTGDYILEPNEVVRIHSGPDATEDLPKDIKWTANYIWDEKSGTGYLINPDNQTIHTYNYRGFR